MYSVLIIGLIVGILVVMLCLAVLLSYHSYKPIQSLVRKSESLFTEVPKDLNEFKQLSETLSLAFEHTQDSVRQLHSEMQRLEQQRAIIRTQMVRLILCGRAEEPLEKQLKHIGVRFSNPIYAVAVVNVRKDQRTGSNLVNMLNQLGSDDVHLYAERMGADEDFVILIISTDETGPKKAMELVEAVLEEAGLEYEAALSFCTEHASDVPNAFREARSSASLNYAAPSVLNALQYSDITLPQLSVEIQRGNRTAAKNIFLRLSEQLERRAKSFEIQRAVYSDVVNLLIGIVEKNQLEVETDRIKAALQKDVSQINSAIADTIDEICGIAQKNIQQMEKRVSWSIVQYINEHATDYDITLSKLAAIFSISEKQVSRIVKSLTGVSYKEYVTSLRVAHACTLLSVQNASVTETAEAVGLTNVSYFIRIFRDSTGYTPAQYRRCMSVESSEDESKKE